MTKKPDFTWLHKYLDKKLRKSHREHDSVVKMCEYIYKQAYKHGETGFINWGDK